MRWLEAREAVRYVKWRLQSPFLEVPDVTRRGVFRALPVGRTEVMDAYRAIITKRDTREFEPGPVRDEDMQKILQAARMAGSAKNEQVNRLLVVTDQAQRDRLAKCGKFSSWVAGAPVVIVFVVPAEGGRPFDYGRMAQNILITANSLGLASCPMTLHDEDCTRDVLGLPDELTAPMGVAVGRPGTADPSRKSSRRISLAQLVRWNRWSD